MPSVRMVVATDLHGQILPFDYVHAKPFPGGLSKVSTFLKKQRQEAPTLFFDNGDAFQGSPLTFYAHRFFGNKVNPVVEAYNEMGLNGNRKTSKIPIAQCKHTRAAHWPNQMVTI